MRIIVGVFVSLLLFPPLLYAQGTITGTVRDSSGSVLPGATVEASSPVLIEKVRSAITDGSGQYRIVDLRPGTYAVMVSLQGFKNSRTDNVAIVGSFTAQVNATLEVGAVEETITVIGESALVDVQSTTRQQIADQEAISTLPTARSYMDIGMLIPGVSRSGGQEVGGVLGRDAGNQLSIHGSRGNAQRVTISGLSMSTAVGGGYGGGVTMPPTSVQEYAIDVSAVSAEQPTGGVRINLIPREGGNAFSGTFFGGFAGESMQSSNLTDDLISRGLTLQGKIKSNWDINPSFGGPILKDRLWFFGSFRSNGAWNYIPGMFYNKNTNNPNAWTYEPDLTVPFVQKYSWLNETGRLTWQATPRNKFRVDFMHEHYCQCGNGVSAITAPEAGQERRWPDARVPSVYWQSPVSNKLLLDAMILRDKENWTHNPMWLHNPDLGQDGINTAMISVTEQAGAIPGLTYRARAFYQEGDSLTQHYRGSLTYVTGAHAAKFGATLSQGRNGPTLTAPLQPISYTLRNGAPLSITLRANDFTTTDQYSEFGLFVQDRWTINRLTFSGGVRYDNFRNDFPEQHVGPTALFPTRNLEFPKTENLRWNDLTPRVGLVYDLFGTGRSAARVSLNRYLAGMPSGFATVVNPATALVTSTTRNWNDADRDYVVDCALTNPAANGECLAMANSAFALQQPTPTVRVDPDLRTGWGRRPYDWELSAGIQQELFRGVVLDVAYFRRWFGNFTVYDNLAVTPADFDEYSVTAPLDSRLPNGGGYTVPGLFDIDPSKFGVPSDYIVRPADFYGEQTESWNGVDFNLNTRFKGATLQGGISTGRRTTDNCDVVREIGNSNLTSALGNAAVVVSDGPSPLYCHVQENFLTQVKASGSYNVPRIDVLVAATLQSIPGPQLAANYLVTFDNYGPSLGRFFAGGNASTTRAINIVPPGTMYGDRLNQLDFRVGKLLRFGSTRTLFSVDLYNALNASAALTENSTYVDASLLGWRRPTSAVTARFVKISAQFDF